MRWLGWFYAVVLAVSVILLIPGDQDFVATVLLGFGLSGLGFLIGRAAE